MILKDFKNKAEHQQKMYAKNLRVTLYPQKKNVYKRNEDRRHVKYLPNGQI